MNEIINIAKENNMFVIEDCAEAHGASLKDIPVGTFGQMGCFSTYVAHIITTIEGGVIITNDSKIAETLRSLRSHGRNCNCKSCIVNTKNSYCQKRFKDGKDHRFEFDRVGFSSKMNEIEAIVGLENLKIYDDILQRRRFNLLYLINRFKEFFPYLKTINEGDFEKIGPHAFPIIVNIEKCKFTRDDLSNYLEKNGIETRTLFSSMPTQCRGYNYLGYEYGQFPKAEYAANNGLHIGIHQDLNLEHMKYIYNKIMKFLEDNI